MSFQKSGDLPSLIDQYVKACNEINNSILNIKDEKTLKQLRTNFDILVTNSKKIQDGLDACTDPNVDELQEQYNQACQTFDSERGLWESTLKKKEKELEEALKQKKHEEEMSNLSEEQRLTMQQNDELEYLGRQTEEIQQMAKDLNEITHKVDDKITEDHEKVVKIDEHIETAKTEMQEGNKDLEHAEKDQKKCNIC